MNRNGRRFRITAVLSLSALCLSSCMTWTQPAGSVGAVVDGQQHLRVSVGGETLEMKGGTLGQSDSIRVVDERLVGPVGDSLVSIPFGDIQSVSVPTRRYWVLGLVVVGVAAVVWLVSAYDEFDRTLR